MNEDDDKLPPDRIRRSEGYVDWTSDPPSIAPLPSNPDWATVQRAIPKHPLLAVRAARMLVRPGGPGMSSKEAHTVLAAICPAIDIAVAAGLRGDALVRSVAAHVREHGVQWRKGDAP